MNSGAVGALAAAIGVPLALAIMRKVLPYHPPAAVSSRSLQELHTDYRKWELFAVVPIFVSMTVLVLLWYLVLCWLANWTASGLGPSRFLIAPDAIFWAIPALFLGIVCSAVPTHFLFKALLRERYDEYNLYTNMKAGFDGWKAFSLMAAAIIFIAGVAIAMNLDCYTQVTDREIVIKVPWLVVERRYSFDQIAAIASVKRITTMSGNVVVQPHYAIRFKDGKSWTTKDGWWIATPERGRQLIAYVAEASKKPIEEIDSIEELGRE